MSLPPPSPDCINLDGYTPSAVGTARVRATSPAATAGQGLPAPEIMTARMLGDQAAALVDACVVYSCAPVDGSQPFRRFAGRLSQAHDEEGNAAGYEVRLSEAYNYVSDTEQHRGPDVLYRMPADGWQYSRLVEMSVHQTECATRAVTASQEAMQRSLEQQAQEFRERAEEQTRSFRLELDARLRQHQDHVQRQQQQWAHPPPSPPAPPSPMAMSAGMPYPGSERHPADAADVLEWDSLIESDAPYLVLQLETRWVSGSSHLPGGRILDEAFAALRLWILATAYVSGWGRTPQRELGNHLLRQVLLQVAFVRDRVPRAAIERHLAKEDPTSHPVMRAAAAVGPGAAAPHTQQQHTRPRAAARAPQQRIAAKAPARAPGNGRAGGGRA